jgi:hypothetical protein
MFYMFCPIAAIIRYTELLQSPLFLSAVPPYTGQCLYIAIALYQYVVYVMPLCYKIYLILNTYHGETLAPFPEKKAS